MPGERSSSKTPFSVELSELRDGALNHAPTNPHALHQSPVAMRLAILLACRRAQIHRAPSHPICRAKKRPRVGTTAENPASQECKCLNALEQRPQKRAQSTPTCASSASLTCAESR